jgi:hypothetical protein
MIQVGDKVVCVSESGYWFDEDWNSVNGPKYQDELIVDGFDSNGGLIFFHYDRYEGYAPWHFRKLYDDTVDAIMEMMNERPVLIS